MIRAVIFDMYETLITLFESPLYFGPQMAADAGIPEADFLAIWRGAETDRTIGKVTLEEITERILKTCGRYSEEKMRELVGKRIRYREEPFEHLHPEILPLFRELRMRGIRIGLISNCFSDEAAVIKRSVLFPFFDAVCLSFDEGVQKPDPVIYARCVERLRLTPGECLYVGDGGSRELEAAEEAGMQAAQAVWYLKEGTLQPEKRKEGFRQMETPLEIIKLIEEDR